MIFLGVGRVVRQPIGVAEGGVGEQVLITDVTKSEDVITTFLKE